MARRAPLLRVLCAGLALAALCSAEERLPGWQGEQCVREASRRLGRLGLTPLPRHKGTPLLRSDAGETREQPWLEQLSWHPRAWLYHGFLSREECEYLIEQARQRGSERERATPASRSRVAQARPEMTKSSVVDNVSGKSLDSECVRAGRLAATSQHGSREGPHPAASAPVPACSCAAARTTQ